MTSRSLIEPLAAVKLARFLRYGNLFGEALNSDLYRTVGGKIGQRNLVLCVGVLRNSWNNISQTNLVDYGQFYLDVYVIKRPT
ncbi:hypothetical protein D3C87_1876670 [compost metagenome]